MTVFECVKNLRKMVLLLLVWNVVLSFCLVAGYMEKQTEELNQKICNLEAIPDFEIVEVD
jgi:hypothetical protein